MRVVLSLLASLTIVTIVAVATWPARGRSGVDSRAPALAELPAPRGCASTRARSACQQGRAVGGSALDGSPNGEALYVTDYAADAVAVLRPDSATGMLKQPSGSDGCISWRMRNGCAAAVGINSPEDVAASPDGRHVYVAAGGTVEFGIEEDYPWPGSDAVTVYAADPVTGALSQLPGGEGCIQSARRFRSRPRSGEPGCRTGRALAGAHSIVTSPDGRFVYVVAGWTSGIAVFARDATTGALSQLAGQLGCVRSKRREGCAVAAIGEVTDAVVSPDGRFLYVTGTRGATTRQYHGAIHVFARDVSTGQLRWRGGPRGCFRPDCRGLRSFALPTAIAVSPNGSHLYAATSDAIFAFRRDSVTGAVLPLAGRARCIRDAEIANVPGCRRAAGLATIDDVAVSPDGAFLYVAAGSTVTVLRRDAEPGGLHRLSGAGACIANYRGISGCIAGRRFEWAENIHVSHDARHLYVAVGDGVEGFIHNR